MMRNLQAEIDVAFAKTVEELRAKYVAEVGEVGFSGQVTGVMLATAIKLAKDGGCPRSVLERNVEARIKEEYGS